MLAIQVSGWAGVQGEAGGGRGQQHYVSLSFLKTRCFVSLVMQKARIHMRRTVELAQVN